MIENSLWLNLRWFNFAKKSHSVLANIFIQISLGASLSPLNNFFKYFDKSPLLVEEIL